MMNEMKDVLKRHDLSQLRYKIWKILCFSDFGDSFTA